MDDRYRIPEEVIHILKQASTGVVADALAMIGFQGGVEGIHPARGFEEVKLVGPACTVQFGPPRPDTPKLTTYGIIEHLPPGSILILEAKDLNQAIQLMSKHPGVRLGGPFEIRPADETINEMVAERTRAQMQKA